MAIRTRDWRLVDNVIAGSGDGLLIVLPAWAHLLESFRAESNRYAHADRPDAFGVLPRHGFEFPISCAEQNDQLTEDICCENRPKS